MIKPTVRHLMIPDVQAKPGVNTDHLTWIGRYLVDKKPDAIICIGDFADMPSLSSYDKGKASFEGRRYVKDIQAARDAMDKLLAPMYQYNDSASRKNKYEPLMVMTLGNHEKRIDRAAESQPELGGLISYDDLPYEDWEVYDYLEPVFIDEICYSHFMANPMTGNPYSGSCANILQKVGCSFMAGHAQKLDAATRFTVKGVQQWGIVAGACYTHNEGYKGHQGNYHWRGVVMANDVKNGSFDPMFVSLDYLKRRYS